MTEPLQVGQFAIVDHEPVDRGPNAGIFHGKGPTDDRAELYIVAEGTTPAADAFTGHVVSTLGLAWATLDMSLTGALGEVFKTAERNLRDWNQKSLAQHQVNLGLTCFARRGAQAVIAQVGPSAVFHASSDGVQVYLSDDDRTAPLNGSGDGSPQLNRIRFGPGDRLLLISSPALGELDDEVISGILTLPGATPLQDLYQRLRHLREVTVLLLSFPTEQSTAAEPRAAEDLVIDATGDPPGPALNARPPGSATVADQAQSFQPSLFIEDEAHEVLLTARRQLIGLPPRQRIATLLPELASEAPEPLRRAAGDLPRPRAIEATESQVMAGRSINSATATAWRALPQQPPVSETGSPRSTIDHRRNRRESFSRSLVREEARPRPEHTGHGLPLVDELVEDSRSRALVFHPVSETIAGESTAAIARGGSLVRVRENMGGRWKGGGHFGSRTTSGSQMPPTWLIVVVGLAILVGLVGMVTVPRILRENSSQRYMRLIDTAQQQMAIARVQQDPSERRKALTEAQALLLEAKGDGTPSTDVQQLMTSVTDSIAAMDAIKSPAAVDTIASLEQFGDKPLAVARLTIGDTQAFILDSTSGQVIAVSLANGDKKVIYSEDKDARRARPVATAYLEAGDQGPVLLIADTARNLWSYSAANGVRPLLFSAPNNLSITDIAVSGRDLYVLDSAQAVVLKFAAGDGGYLNPPTKALESPDLASARRIMVDGDIIITDANGTIRRSSGQLSLELSEAGIDKRLISPEVVQPLTRDGDLAILDAPNDRIVVIRRDGLFDRQYKHAELQSMSAFAVRNGVGYVFAGGKLKKITW